MFCDVLWLLWCTDTNTLRPLQQRQNWRQTLLPVSCFTSGANGRNPDLLPATADTPDPPHPVWYSPSDPSGQSSPSLQASFSHMGKHSKGLIYPKRYYDPSATPQYIDIYHEDQPDPTSAAISPFVSTLYLPRPSQPVLIRDTPRQFIPYRPLLLLVTPHQIIHPPQTPLKPENLPLTLMLHLLLPSLYRIEISPYPRPIFWPLDKEIPTGKSFEVICKWLMDPHRPSLPWFWFVFTVDCSWWVLLIRSC